MSFKARRRAGSPPADRVTTLGFTGPNMTLMSSSVRYSRLLARVRKERSVWEAKRN